jgi:hypothetical protein
VKINKSTQLWEDLTPTEIGVMCRWAKDVVLYGKLEYPTPPWLMLWYSELGFDEDRQRLMLQSTAVPQRVLLSTVEAMKTGYFRSEVSSSEPISLD